MISTLHDALRKELADVPEEIQDRVLRVIANWDSGEIARKMLRDHHDGMQRFYERFVKHGDLVFDVGANIGERTEIFLALGASVVAVEPHAGCINTLKNKFGQESRVNIVPKALGSENGSSQLWLVDECPGISSMSEKWLKAVQETNRFGCTWSKQQTVEVTTLDDLIGAFGTPAFVKIDVEGSEDTVLSGLSTAVPFLSFEFTPEYLESAERCVRKLESLGRPDFTYSVWESMELHPEWVSANEIIQYLNTFKGNAAIYGDVYVRFQ